MQLLQIKDFCRTGSGGTPSRSKQQEYYVNGTIPWVKSGELARSIVDTASEYITEAGLKGSSAKLLQPGAILIAMYGATVGQVSKLGITAATNQAICNIYPDTNICDLDYLYWVLKSAKDHLLSQRVGGGQPNISQTIIKSLKIPLPPLSEQKRIAGILDAADSLRAKRREALAQLDTLLQSTFLDLFGDPVTNPKGWEQQELSSLIEGDDKINYGVVQPGDDDPTGKPLIRVGDFVSGELNTTKVKCISAEIEKKYSRSRLNGRELLVSCVGSVGTICRVPKSAKGYNIARAVARIPLKEEISREFMMHCLRAPSVQRYFLKETRTVSQPTLNIALIKTAPVFFPPHELQQHFAAIVEKVEAQKARMRRQLDELDTLYAALQQRAFNGKL